MVVSVQRYSGLREGCWGHFCDQQHAIPVDLYGGRIAIRFRFQYGAGDFPLVSSDQSEGVQAIERGGKLFHLYGLDRSGRHDSLRA
jgi:hypothetical protein